MTTITSLSDLSPEQLQLYNSQKKSVGSAYLRWFFLGGFGVHYFYLGGETNIKRAKWRLIPTVIIIGLPVSYILVFIDLFKLAGHVEERNAEIVAEIKAASKSA